MKQISLAINIVITGILLVLLTPNLRARATTATPPPPTPADAAQPISCDRERTVQTSGTATVNVVPDRALIQLGVQSNATTIAEVQKDNEAAMQRALDALGIDSKDIATDWYYVEPVYSSYDSVNIKGYRINNTVAITLRDVKRVNEVISNTLDGGANQVINVELYTSELRKYRDQAREMAVQAAREKADLLSGAAGAQTGCVITLTENVWSYYNGWYGRGGGNIWAQNAVQNAPQAGAGTMPEAGAVRLGQIAIQAEVTSTFGLK